MKQKLAVSCALLPEPALLLLDEPTAGVDVVARDEIWAMLRARGAATLILISTSYLEEVAACERLVYLDGGPCRRQRHARRAARQRADRALSRLGRRPARHRARGAGAALRRRRRAPRAATRASRCSAHVRRARPQVLRDLAALPAAVRIAEQAPIDMEATLLHLARGGPHGVIIAARGLTKRFGDFTAVDDLTLTVEPKTIFAFLGANGSGKSTTIRMLIGLLRPTAGAIELDGVDVIRHPRRVRDRIGYMGQKVSLYQGLSLRENVEFYAGLGGLAGAALERRWGALRERFALGDAEGEQPENLPAGIRQRAGLAVATLHRPRVLFLDEPTAGVDVHNRALFWDLIQEEAAAGVTVFVTTHFLEEVDYCDWAVFIDAGRLIANAAPEDLRRLYSPGYRIRADLPVSALDADAARLRAAGFSWRSANGAVELTVDALAPAALAALERVVVARGARVQIEQPAMADVFRRLVAGGPRA